MYQHLVSYEWHLISGHFNQQPKELAPLTNFVRSLAGLDGHLFKVEERVSKKTEAEHYEHDAEADYASFQAHLWVLGSYEVIRTLCDFYNPKKNPTAPSIEEALRDSLVSAKRQFAEVRMPLAKLQPRGEANYIYPWPVQFLESGALGWQLGSGPYILRRNLSLAFLKAMGEWAGVETPTACIENHICIVEN